MGLGAAVSSWRAPGLMDCVPCPTSPRPRARSLCPLRVKAGPGRALIPSWGSGEERPRGARWGKTSWRPG